MASYRQFEEVPVWQAAIKLAGDVFSLTAHPAFKFRGDLVNQIRRASLSVSNNIAEGYERGTTSDLINFLYIARGSCGESRSMMRFAQTLEGMETEREAIDAIAEQCAQVSRQLWGWIDALKNSSIAGDRRQTDKTRGDAEIERLRAEFNEKYGYKAANEAAREGRYGEFCGEKMKAYCALQDALAIAGQKVGEETCPICNGKMIKRHDRSGHPFWGCANYPRCKGTRPWVST